MDHHTPISTTNKSYRFLLHCFYATGHVLPMQAVARVLVNRGHEVVWLTDAGQESRVLASGAKFVAAQEVSLADAVLRTAEPDNLEGAAQALFGGRLTAQVADLRRVLTEFQPDCLLNDALPQGAAAIYDLGEVPFYATLGVVPMYLPVSDMPSDTERVPTSGLGTIMSRPAFVLPIINPQRLQLGLGPVEPSPTLHYSPLLHIQASCPSLEFQETAQSGQPPLKLHYVGPLVAPATNESFRPSWWEDIRDASCVIGITQGTFAVDPSALIIPAIEALSEDKKLVLVIPSPLAAKIRETIKVSENVHLAEWVPYGLLLPRCSLLITNGGYGSVTQALSHGVPLVCAGVSEDKMDTAARVTWVGAGIDLATSTPSPRQIREAVHKILNDSSYRDRAIQVSKELNALGGAERACDILEDAVRMAV